MAELGPYRLLRRLGQGGMGEVWEAELRDAPGVKVAVKTVLTGQEAPAAVHRLLDEARLVSALRHPHIVAVLDSGVEAGRCYFVMELLEGRSLDAVTARSQPLPPGAVVGLGLQLLSALAHAHGARGPQGEPLEVVHRDIKPSNIFLTREGRAKLIDFGLARAAVVDRTKTQSGGFRGSLAYTSPEQARAETPDARSDLFSLGLVLHELLTGRRVFSQTQEAALLGQVLWAPIPAVRDIVPQAPALLDAALAQTLQRDSGRRPVSAEALRKLLGASIPEGEIWDEAAWAQWLAAQPLGSGGIEGTQSLALPALGAVEQRAPTPPTAEEPRRRFENRSPEGSPARRPRLRPGLWRGLAGVTLAVLVSGAVWTGWRRRHPDPLPSPQVQPTGPSGLDARPAAVGPSGSEGSSSVPPVPAPRPERSPAPVESVRRPRTPSATVSQARGMGLLTVESRPVWANIRIDGEDVGPTPLVQLRLSAGRHRLEATRKDGASMRREVVLSAGQEERVLLSW